MTEKNSDSSYDAEETPETQQSAPACSAAGGSCCASAGSCCANCPCSKLAPENLEATLTHNSSFVEEFQGAIFFRRPIAFAALIVSVNLVFFLYRTLNLSFYAKACLIGLAYIGFQLIPAALISTAKSILFPGQLAKGGNSDPNRVREINELVAPINALLAPLFTFGKIIHRLSQDDSVVGLAIYAGVFFCIFILTASINIFWPLVILTNLALILPGVLTLPPVVPYVKKACDACCGNHLNESPAGGADAVPTSQPVDEPPNLPVEEAPDGKLEE